MYDENGIEGSDESALIGDSSLGNHLGIHLLGKVNRKSKHRLESVCIIGLREALPCGGVI